MEIENRLNILSYIPFMTDEVIAVCSANSPLRLQTLTLDHLPTIPLALREAGSGTLAVVETALKRHGVDLSSLQIRIRLGGTEALKNFVLADTCLSFLPRLAILNELEGGTLVELPIAGLSIKRNFHFIQRKGTESNLWANAFIRATQRHYSFKE